jgi:hypothetical protein
MFASNDKAQSEETGSSPAKTIDLLLPVHAGMYLER